MVEITGRFQLSLLVSLVVACMVYMVTALIRVSRTSAIRPICRSQITPVRS